MNTHLHAQRDFPGGSSSRMLLAEIQEPELNPRFKQPGVTSWEWPFTPAPISKEFIHAFLAFRYEDLFQFSYQ